jgi:hypothetical protein
LPWELGVLVLTTVRGYRHKTDLSERIYGPAITLLVGLLFGWLLITGLRRGLMEWPCDGLGSDRHH